MSNGKLFTPKEARRLFYALLLGSVLFGGGVTAIAVTAQGQQCQGEQTT